MWKGEVVMKLKDKIFKDNKNEDSADGKQPISDVHFNNEFNWEQVYIKADKYSGSLRYTTNQAEMQDERFPMLIKGVHSLDVIEVKKGDYYIA